MALKAFDIDGMALNFNAVAFAFFIACMDFIRVAGTRLDRRIGSTCASRQYAEKLTLIEPHHC